MKHFFLVTLLFMTSLSFAQRLSPTETEVLVLFKVTDDKSVPEQGAVVGLTGPDKKVLNSVANPDGIAEILLNKGVSYLLSVEKASLKFDFGKFDVPKDAGRLTMEENLEIKVVTEYKNSYKLNIHFAPNKAELYDSAKVEVDKLYDKLVKNPSMRIEVAGHTDNVGDDALNLHVSQKRCAAIKEYLLQKGIAEKRIIAKGYGESTPIADNATEAGRKQNRRIEIRMF